MQMDVPKKLRVAIVSGLLHHKYGGPGAVVKMHMQALETYADVELFGVVDSGEMEECQKLFPGAHLFKKGLPSRWYRGVGLRRALMQRAGDFDVIHVHMLWDHTVWASSLAAQFSGAKLVITPHGSISEPWRYRAWYKRLYRKILLDTVLARASVVQALNQAEANACKEFGINCALSIVPNALSAAEFEKVREPALAQKTWPALSGRRMILYLGRLWWDKGLDILPEAWANLKNEKNFDDCLLVLAGADYRNCKADLQEKIRILGIERNVILTGLVEGQLKDSLLGASECVVLPSKSEGFSMTLLEAMAAKKAVLCSSACNAPEIAQVGAGWEIERCVENLSAALREVMRSSPDELKQRGQNGHAYAKENFTTELLAQKLLELYRANAKSSV